MALNFPDNPVVGYIYNDPTSSFAYEWDGTVWKSYTTASVSNIKQLDNIAGLFDNNTVSFPLTVDGDSVINATTKQLLISVGGVIQNPTVDFDVVGSNIVFTTAPTTGLSFFGTLLGTAQTEQVSVYNKQSYTPVGIQTNFTFSTGYTVGYLDVFRNGVRLVSGSDFTASDGSTFVLSPPAQNGDDIEAVGFNVNSVTSIDGNITNLNVSGYANVVGVTTLNSRLTITSGGANITGVVTATSFVGNVTGNSTGLSGSPNINVGSVVGTSASFSNLISNETRAITGSEKLIRADGNIVNLVYNSSTGANVGFATNPTNNITLNVTGIPTSSDFDNQTVTFAVIVNNTGTARTCTSITLNGVSRTIKWIGGSLSSALSGVTTTTGYTIFSFTGINTVGSASTTSNYDVLGVVNGGFW